MNRIARTDPTLDALSDERDHLAIQISLLDDALTPNAPRLAGLRDKLIVLERRISHYRPMEG